MWICPKFKCPNIDKMTKEMSYCPECGSPDRIAEFDKKFPNGDGPPSSYQPN